MIRPVFLSAASVIALASALFVPAADARQEQAPGEPKAEARPFIETSYVIAPERIGDFVLEGDAQLGPVATLYGLKLGEEDGNQALGRFMAQQIGGQPVVGDQVEWNGLTWTVALMEGNKVRKVGVRFPEGQGKPGPGLFL